MKHFLLFVLFFLNSFISSFLVAQVSPEVSWIKELEGLKDDIVNQIVPASDGGYYVIGATKSSDADYKFCYTCGEGEYRGFVMKLDFEGKIVWSRIPVGDQSQKDIYHNGWFAGVEVNDGIVVLGYSNSGPKSSLDNNSHIVKLNKFTGELIWRRNIGDFVKDYYGHDGFAIVATTEGFLVASRSDANYQNMVLVRLSHEGTEINRRTIENFKFSPTPILTFGGAPQKESSTGGNGYSVNTHNLIQKTNDNNFIIAGVMDVNEPSNKCFIYPSDLRVLKINAALNTIWDKKYTTPTADQPMDLVILPSNEIVMLGSSCAADNEPRGPFNVNHSKWLLKLNPIGDFKAIEKLDEYSQYGSKETVGISLSCDNKILLSGQAWSSIVVFPFIEKKELDMKTNIWFSYLDLSFFLGNINDITLDNSKNIIGWGRAYGFGENIFLGKLKSECGSTGRCQNATPIQCGQTLSGTTVGVTSTFSRTDYTCHSTSSPFDGGDVVYEFEMNNGTGNLDISLISNTDLDVFLFNRCDATGLNCISKSIYPTRPSGGNAELIRYYDLPNGTYYIVVDGARTSNNGIFEITLTCGVLNCLDAKTLTCNQALTESNSDGINNASSYCGIKNTAGSLNGFAGRGKEKVYQFTINQAQTVKVDLTGMSSGSDFDLYVLSDCDPDKCVASSFNAGTQNETVSPMLGPGVYYAVVESYYDKVGSYTIKASCTTGGGTIPRPRIVLPMGLVGETGQELKYPITASNFRNMAAMEFSINVDDPTILNIIGVEGKAITPAYNLVSSSNIGLSWFSSNQPTVTVPDGEVLFNLIFKIKATSGSTAISITDKPTVPYGLANNNGVLQTVSLEIGDGLVTVNESLVQLCGEVTKEDGNAITGVTLDLSGSKIESGVNQVSGNYCFASLPKGGSFSIKPKKNTNYRNGLNGRDLYLMQRHILGEKIISPYRIIAGDYNGDNLINGRDLYLTQRLILGDSTTLPIGSWRFIPKSYKFPDYTNPFIGNLSEKIDLNNLGQSAIGQDFIGVKVGDVDNTSTFAGNELSSRSGAPLKLSLSKHKAQPNSLVTLSLSASGFQNITSMDYTLQWDTTVIKFVNFEAPANNPLGLSAGNFEATTSPGKLIST
ncbi:MAG: pre-peptidase C-terminal domain-containing protein [Saprospiraceae bacterium]|nr:pre-peptidase C-terminal domain-containing protein [Candidatus Vicinibacter affinis]